MPCRSGFDEYDCSQANSALEDATQAGCEMAKILTLKQRDALSNKTRRWVETHEKADRKRLAEEAEDRKAAKMKKQALAKLSRSERNALGI